MSHWIKKASVAGALAASVCLVAALRSNRHELLKPFRAEELEQAIAGAIRN